MTYQSIRFYNFRNLENEEVALGGKIYYLVGENGAGKSSFLEGLYLLSYGSSFRENNLENCLRKPEQPLAIGGRVSQEEQSYQIQVQYEKGGRGGKKEIRLNDKKLQDRRELLSITSSIAFAPGDIAYVNGSPKDKRQFIDQMISLIDPYYIDLSRAYMKIVTQRNWVLKTRQEALLATYTLQLVQVGLEIQRRRTQHVAQLSQVFSELFSYVSNFGFSVMLNYWPSWPPVSPEQSPEESIQNCLEYLAQRREREFLSGTSLSGPHRDYLQFTAVPLGVEERQESPPDQVLARQDFAKRASTGQLRLAALVLKSAQANYVQQKSVVPSVLLFDDVLLEMDLTRRKLFLASLPPYQQVFFTLLPTEDFHSYPFCDYQVLHVKQGRIERGEEQ